MLSNRFALCVGKSQKLFSIIFLSEVNKITEKTKCPILNTERHKTLFPYFYIFLLNNIINEYILIILISQFHVLQAVNLTVFFFFQEKMLLPLLASAKLSLRTLCETYCLSSITELKSTLSLSKQLTMPGVWNLRYNNKLYVLFSLVY